MTGTVRRLVSEKGFGFIQAGSIDFFFHRDDYQDDWNELIFDYNQGAQVKVRFEVVKSAKGPRGGSVIRIEDESLENA